MILVWDNGELYDDRDTLLLEVPIPGGYTSEADRLKSLYPLFERLLRRQHSASRILAQADSVFCLGKYTPEHVADYIPPSSLFKWKRNPAKFGRDVANVVPRDEAWQLGKPVVALFAVHWSTRLRSDPGLDLPGDVITFLKAIDAWVRAETEKPA